MPCSSHASLSKRAPTPHNPRHTPTREVRAGATGQGRGGHGHIVTPCPHALAPSLPGPRLTHSRSQDPAHPLTDQQPPPAHPITHPLGPSLPITRALPASFPAPAPCRPPSPRPPHHPPQPPASPIIPPRSPPDPPLPGRTRRGSHVSRPETAVLTCPGKSRRGHAPCLSIGCAGGAICMQGGRCPQRQQRRAGLLPPHYKAPRL